MHRCTLILRLTTLCIAFSIAMPVYAQNAPPEEPTTYLCNGEQIELNCICLLEPLPNGTTKLCTTPGASLTNSLFFDYLKTGTMFTWGLSIGAALAILNVTVGGFQIMTAGADPGQFEAGKVRIFGSILGLIFLMFAGVFLNFINPLGFTF